MNEMVGKKCHSIELYCDGSGFIHIGKFKKDSIGFDNLDDFKVKASEYLDDLQASKNLEYSKEVCKFVVGKIAYFDGKKGKITKILDGKYCEYPIVFNLFDDDKGEIKEMPIYFTRRGTLYKTDVDPSLITEKEYFEAKGIKLNFETGDIIKHVTFGDIKIELINSVGIKVLILSDKSSRILDLGFLIDK